MQRATPELTAAEQGFVARGAIPLIALVAPLTRWWEDRHLELLAEAGFTDARRAHNAVMENLPADGRRLTEIADAAGISKQATAELVQDLVEKGYLRRIPDPSDGRAKLIIWDERGKAAFEATLQIFAALEAELVSILGDEALTQLKSSLGQVLSSLLASPTRSGSA